MWGKVRKRGQGTTDMTLVQVCRTLRLRMDCPSDALLLNKAWILQCICRIKLNVFLFLYMWRLNHLFFFWEFSTFHYATFVVGCALCVALSIVSFAHHTLWRENEVWNLLVLLILYVAAAVVVKLQQLYLSTAIATRVKTDADTEMPWTIPLILQTRLPKGHPVERKDAFSWLIAQTPS